MRLEKFVIRNFKGIKDLTLEWDDIIVLIGENNTGKSSVLQALQQFCKGDKLSDKALFHNEVTDRDHAIVLEGHFTDLSEADLGMPAVRGNTDGDHWRIRKTFWLTEDDNGVEKAEELPEACYGQREYPDAGNERSFGAYPATCETLVAQVRAEADFVDCKVPNPAFRTRLRELMDSVPGLVTTSQPEWHANPGGGANWKSNLNKVLPDVVLVPAVEDASDATAAKTTSTYGKLLARVLTKTLLRRPEFDRLRENLEQIRCLFTPPEGSDACRAQEIEELQSAINDRLQSIMKAARAEIHAEFPEMADMLFPATYMMIDDGKLTAVSHQGHGLQRALLVALVQTLAEEEVQAAREEVEEALEDEATPAFTSSIILAIEEPEIYLHPQMERKMRDALYSLSEQAGYQTICTTHSPVFLDMASAHSAIVRLEKNNQRRVSAFQVREEIFTGDNRKEQKRWLRMITEFDPAVNELFFARRVVLVEGDTEMVVIPKAAQLFGIFERDPDLEHDVTLINCHGKSTIPLFQEVLNHFDIAYTVLHDEDPGKAKAVAVNEAIGAACGDRAERQMFCPDIEGTLEYDAGDRDKPITALLTLVRLADDNAYLPRQFIDCIYQVYTGQPAPDEYLKPNGDATAFRPWFVKDQDAEDDG